MPTIEVAASDDINDIDDIALVAILPQYIWELMMYPEDMKGRTAHLQAILSAAGKNLIEKAGERPIPSDIALLFCQPVILRKAKPAVWAPSKSGVDAYMFGGVIAGWILIITRLVSQKKKIDIGIMTAYEIVKLLLSGLNMMGLEKRHLQITWKKYRGVAHLWAAYILIYPDSLGTRKRGLHFEVGRIRIGE